MSEHTAASNRSGAPSTVLVVEDSPVQAELLRRALAAAGYRVLVAGDGAAGLALAREQHPDAIVSDINMPLLDGYGLCRALRADPALKATPVILLTMLTDPQDVIRGVNAGADAYLTKPCNMVSLLARLAQLLAYPPLAALSGEFGKAEVRLNDTIQTVEASLPRILSLLISTYQNAVLQNDELAVAEQALEDANLHLEQKVHEKTAQLLQSEQRFRALIENGTDLVALLDAHGVLTYVSPSIARICGYDAGEMLGKPYLDFIHPDEASAAAIEFASLIATPGAQHQAQWRFRNKQGDWVVLDSMAHNALPDPAINGIVVNARDVTGRKEAQDELVRLNWALRALGKGSAAMVHAVTENELFQACCDAIAGAGGYPLAWLGLAKGDESVAIVARAGEAVPYLQGLSVSWADTPQGRGPTGTAIRSGQTQVNNNLTTNDAFLPWVKGASTHGFASSLALPIRANGAVLGALSVYSRVADAFKQPEIALFEELAADIGYGIRSRRMRTERDQLLQQQLLDVGRLKDALISTIGAIALMVEKRDPYTAGHQQRVAALCVAIGTELGLSDSVIEGLRLGATIHDIGKIYVPAEILSRPGKLTAPEFGIIKEHPQIGYDIVKEVKFPWPIKEMILQHHERLDGSGYPQGLRGDAISIEARIIAVADMIEAMSSHRPYREGFGLPAALAQARQDAGTLLDAQVVQACERVFGQRGFIFEKA
jgi:PAS domain S-box-containing protein